MTDQKDKSPIDNTETVEPEQHERRNFLVGLGKWSKAVIGGVLLGGVLAPGRDAEAVGWANRGGGKGSWVNFRGGGWGGGWGWGPGWYNRRPGGWYNRRPSWYNAPSWYNRPGWYNGPGWGGSWVNR